MEEGGVTNVDFEFTSPPYPYRPPEGGEGEQPELNGRRAHALLAEQVRRERVTWLEGMEGRIPRRSVSLLVGDPGLGKSLLSLTLAADVSRAGGFALLATAEDSLSATARPRLEAVGADLGRIGFIQLWEDGYPDGLRIPDDIAELDRLATESAADLVVIDPLMAHLPAEVNSWRDQSVRLALAPLHGLAERRECAVLVLAHLNKSMSSDWLRRVGGSVGISGAARSVLLLARDPDDADAEQGRRRVLAHVKCNVGPESDSLLYEIEPVLIPANGTEPEVETARIVGRGGSDHNAERLLSTRGDPDERSAMDEAVAFLVEELGSRVMDARMVKRAAGDFGISPRTLDRAKQRVGVISERVGGVGSGGHWTWRLRTPQVLADLGNGEVGELSPNTHEYSDTDVLYHLSTPSMRNGALSDDPDEVERLAEVAREAQGVGRA